jgi:hypothetical protein
MIAVVKKKEEKALIDAALRLYYQMDHGRDPVRLQVRPECDPIVRKAGALLARKAGVPPRVAEAAIINWIILRRDAPRRPSAV